MLWTLLSDLFGIFLHNSKYVIGHVTKGIKLYLDNTQLDRVKAV